MKFLRFPIKPHLRLMEVNILKAYFKLIFEQKIKGENDIEFGRIPSSKMNVLLDKYNLNIDIDLVSYIIEISKDFPRIKKYLEYLFKLINESELSEADIKIEITCCAFYDILLTKNILPDEFKNYTSLLNDYSSFSSFILDEFYVFRSAAMGFHSQTEKLIKIINFVKEINSYNAINYNLTKLSLILLSESFFRQSDYYERMVNKILFFYSDIELPHEFNSFDSNKIESILFSQRKKDEYKFDEKLKSNIQNKNIQPNFSSADFDIYQILSLENACDLGIGTQWCISTVNKSGEPTNSAKEIYRDRYEYANVYMFFDKKTKRRVLISFGSGDIPEMEADFGSNNPVQIFLDTDALRFLVESFSEYGDIELADALEHFIVRSFSMIRTKIEYVYDLDLLQDIASYNSHEFAKVLKLIFEYHRDLLNDIPKLIDLLELANQNDVSITGELLSELFDNIKNAPSEDIKEFYNQIEENLPEDDFEDLINDIENILPQS